MKLLLERTTFSSKTSIGKLSLNGVFFCYTLEDRDRHLEVGGEKVLGQTAIPRGIYEVVLSFSQRFQKELPEVKGVKNYVGVRIHPGNDCDDTEGCILVGSVKGIDFIGNSRVTFEKLMERLRLAVARKETMTLEVK